MSESVNLPRLIMSLAAEAGCDPAEARRFLHEFFDEIEEQLLAGNKVVIKGVGTFVPGDDTMSPVRFLADPELASVANEPFAAFSAVELNEDVTDEVLSAAAASVSDVVTEPMQESRAESEQVPDSAPITEAAPAEEPMTEFTPTSEPEPPLIPDPGPELNPGFAQVIESESIPAPEPQPQHSGDVYEDIAEMENPAPRHGLWLVTGILIGLIVGLIVGYFAGRLMYASDYDIPVLDSLTVVPNPEVSVAQSDTATAAESAALAVAEDPAPEAVATPVSVEPVYDTVTRNRFLTTMARDHYGKKNYWIFIYMANSHLGNPNTISPGTRIVIPARESFSEPTPEATDAKARRLLNELSRKYKL